MLRKHEFQSKWFESVTNTVCFRCTSRRRCKLVSAKKKWERKGESENERIWFASNVIQLYVLFLHESPVLSYRVGAFFASDIIVCYRQKNICELYRCTSRADLPMFCFVEWRSDEELWIPYLFIFALSNKSVIVYVARRSVDMMCFFAVVFFVRFKFSVSIHLFI